MKNVPSNFSQRSAKKTVIFVIILLSLVVIFSAIAIYQMHKQSTVLIQSESYAP